MNYLTFQRNYPIDLRRFFSLIDGDPENVLLWPNASIPFIDSEWQSAFDNTLSFFVSSDGHDVGHFAIISAQSAGMDTEKPGAFVVMFVYVKPDIRSRGVGRLIMAFVEMLVRSELDGSKLILQVRDYNPRAIRCYNEAGFRKISQNGSAIRMVKLIRPHGRKTAEQNSRL